MVRNAVSALTGAVLVVIATIGVSPSHAADICRAIALRDVPALDNPTSILSKGEYDDAITGYRVDPRTKMGSFCSHGGYCYPTHLVVGGRTVEALRLTNCRIGKRVPPMVLSNGKLMPDPSEEIDYEVDVIRSAIAPQALREDDVDNRLLELGLCSACAGNIAAFYVRQPRSPCAQLARSALEGNPDALRQLQADPPFCRFWR